MNLQAATAVCQRTFSAAMLDDSWAHEGISIWLHNSHFEEFYRSNAPNDGVPNAIQMALNQTVWPLVHGAVCVRRKGNFQSKNTEIDFVCFHPYHRSTVDNPEFNYGRLPLKQWWCRWNAWPEFNTVLSKVKNSAAWNSPENASHWPSVLSQTLGLAKEEPTMTGQRGEKGGSGAKPSAWNSRHLVQQPMPCTNSCYEVSGVCNKIGLWWLFRCVHRWILCMCIFNGAKRAFPVNGVCVNWCLACNFAGMHYLRCCKHSCAASMSLWVIMKMNEIVFHFDLISISAACIHTPESNVCSPVQDLCSCHVR